MAPELIYTFECERIVRGWMRSRKRSDSTEFERASADSSNARFVPRPLVGQPGRLGGSLAGASQLRMRLTRG